jgi:hypothetical protein
MVIDRQGTSGRRCRSTKLTTTKMESACPGRPCFPCSTGRSQTRATPTHGANSWARCKRCVRTVSNSFSAAHSEAMRSDPSTRIIPLLSMGPSPLARGRKGKKKQPPSRRLLPDRPVPCTATVARDRSSTTSPRGLEHTY